MSRHDPTVLPPLDARPTTVSPTLPRGTAHSAVSNLLSGDRVAIGAAVHEIQNVLTSVLGWVELAQANRDPAVLDRALPIVHRGVSRAGALVASLIDPVASFGVRDERFDVGAVVATVRDLLDARCAAAHVTLRATLPAEPVEAQGDPERVEQVLTNLVLNAANAILSARQRGAEAGTIELSVQPMGGRIAVVVRDDGVGIDPSTRARIFDPFFSTRPTETPLTAAVRGLGLAVSRALSEAMGAQLDVDSTPGRGAAMVLALRRPRTDSEMALPLSVQGTEARLRPGARVLVIDDDPAIRELLEVALSLRGARVMVTTEVEDARRLLARGEVDVALVDETLGENSSGAAFLMEMALIAPRVGRVLMTGAPSVDHVPSAARGIVVRKPFLLDDVVRSLAVALQER
ncbi:MAG: response regulator [Deltaproteobacteria bacterium]|nr:response regulator [Deltaproteobacteria bacterium]